jgi:O-acetyl-ADP-ribose deacetylase (regulator of RNase III)
VLIQFIVRALDGLSRYFLSRVTRFRTRLEKIQNETFFVCHKRPDANSRGVPRKRNHRGNPLDSESRIAGNFGKDTTMTDLQNRIAVVEGDITKQQVDAIVNAANTTLLGGGGVDGAIHRAAGPELLEECRALGGCPTGQARITKGYRLPARWIIHTVGPVWRDGNHREDELLAGCYRNCFALAERHGIRTIAFLSISTGAYGFPVERAARIAARETRNFLSRNQTMEKVLLVCFGHKAFEIHESAVGEICLRQT